MENQVQEQQYSVTADGVLHYTTSSGVQVKLPLSAKTRVFRKMQELEEIEALYFLIEEIGNKELVSTVDEMDVLDTFELLSVWSNEFEKRLKKVISRHEAASLK